MVLTVSGGISLGAYQSGVNWTLLKFLKRARFDDDYRRNNGPETIGSDGVRRRAPLPKFDLSSVAGASAGNINGLLAAVEWCGEAWNTPPEESLLWSTWITTGWEQLFPPDSSLTRPRNPKWIDSTPPPIGGAVFTRRYYHESMYPLIKQRLAKATPTDSCDVPVGITITRLIPDSSKVLGSASAANQRYASIVRVVGWKDSVGLQFKQPDAELRRNSRALGALVALATGGTNTITADTVLGLVEASSAFPVAFAPRMLYYHLLDKVSAGDLVCPLIAGQCALPDSARFVDGGVFDNNPLDLALEMSSRRRCKPSSTDATQYDCEVHGPPTVIFIDPDALRGQLASSRHPAERYEAPGGFAAATGLLQGAISSARQYELQVFGRMIERLVPENKRATLLASTRAMPLAGERLSAFGAFLGRPLREYDFYAGVYDGIRLIAEEYLCAGKTDRTCVDDRIKEFIADKHINLGLVAPYVVREFHRIESAAGSVPALSLDGISPEARLNQPHGRQVAVALAIASASQAGLDRHTRTRCMKRPPIHDIFCRDGFDPMLDSLASTRFVRRIISDWVEDCRSAVPALGVPDECMADSTFALALGDRRKLGDDLMSRIIHRAYDVENEFIDRNHNFEAPSQALEFINESLRDRRRSGLSFGASSIPGWEGRASVRVLRVAPWSLSSGIGMGGIIAGWRPGYFLRHGAVGVVAPLDLMRLHIQTPGHTTRTWHAAVGAGLSFRGPRWAAGSLISRVQTSAQFIGDAQGPSKLKNFSTRTFSPSVSVSGIGGKLHLGLRRLPESWSKNDPRNRKIVGSLGVSDLNGLAYWLFRR